MAEKQQIDLGVGAPERGHVVHGDNLDVLPCLAAGSFPLIYIDPPFNTRRTRARTTLTTARSETGDRTGFGGHRYSTTPGASMSYEDRIEDFAAFLRPRLVEARRLLSPEGTLYLHIGQDESHYTKVLLDEVFGRACFLNEIIWAFDFGGRPRNRWPAKHETIFAYVKEPGRHYFDTGEVARIPYMAPDLVGPDKAARGKLPTDVWWHTIVPTNSREKTGYPTQKPEGILERVVSASSPPGSWVLDFFAGSGTTAAVADRLGRRFVMVDENHQAIDVMRERLGTTGVTYSAFRKQRRGAPAAARSTRPRTAHTRAGTMQP